MPECFPTEAGAEILDGCMAGPPGRGSAAGQNATRIRALTAKWEPTPPQGRVKDCVTAGSPSA
jgi:hypothetical protein